jgi:endoribonuclease Dicer
MQQAEVIRVHTDLRVRQYYGDLGVDFWKAERWRKTSRRIR